MKQSLETFFKPSSIAVVGASANPTKIGHAALKNKEKKRFFSRFIMYF